MPLAFNSIEFATEFNYFPIRFTGSTAKDSRRFCDKVKAGKEAYIAYALSKYPFSSQGHNYFEDDRILVPIPKSKPHFQGSVWPSWSIASEIANQGYCRSVEVLIKRHIPIRSSSRSGSSRPTVDEHLNSIMLNYNLFNREVNKILLVDDVVTAGRTSFACAKLINNVFPSIDIKLFSIFRTINDESSPLFEPQIGSINYISAASQTIRRP